MPATVTAQHRTKTKGPTPLHRVPGVSPRLLATLQDHGYTVVSKGHHHEGPLHPELVHGDGAAHVISVDGEHIAGPIPR